MRFGIAESSIQQWSWKIGTWILENGTWSGQHGGWRLENGAWSLQGCEGKEPGARRQPPMRVRFTRASGPNILIDR